MANLVTSCLRCYMETPREMKHIHESNPELLEELQKAVRYEE